MSIKNKEKHIIIFVGYGIGDFIWATSVFPLIKSYDKNIKITLLTFSNYAALIKDLNVVDDYILINRAFFESKKRILRYMYMLLFAFKNYFKLKKHSDAIFLDDNNFLIKCLNKICKLKRIYGSDLQCFGYNLKNKFVDLFTDIIKMPKDMDRFHCMMKYQYMIRSIFPTYNLAIPVLSNTDYLEKQIKQKFLQNTGKYKIALCTNGTAEWRYWPTDYFIELIQNINKRYDISFFIFGNDKKQYETADVIKNSVDNNCDIRNLCKQTSLLEFKEMLKYMDLLISIDSSAVHFAAVYNIPTITFHGQTLPARSGAVNYNAISMCSFEECSPCDINLNKGIVCKYPKCMYNISPEQVFEKVKKILK